MFLNCRGRGIFKNTTSPTIDTHKVSFYNEIVMERQRKFIINFLYFAIILGVVFLFVRFLLPLLAPFVLGLLIAYALQKPTCFLTRKTRAPRKLMAALMVLVFYGTVGVLVALASIKTFSWATQMVVELPSLVRIYVQPVLTQLFQELEQAVMKMDPTLLETVNYMSNQLLSMLGDLMSSLSMWSMQAISSFASSLPMLFLKLLLMVISTFFIAMDFDKLTAFCMRQLDEKGKEIFLQVKKYMVGTLFVCIRSYGLIMSITFCELLLGFTIIGVEPAVILALCIAIFDILPVLGTGGIMIPWAVITALLGDYSLALKLFVLYLVITIIRNIIEPKIVGSQLGLHPVVTLASMFAGVQLAGVVGLFGFPIGLSLMKHLNDTGTSEIFKRPDQS